MPSSNIIKDLKRNIMKTKVTLSAATITRIGTILNHLLANEYLLYTKTLNYHWNVTGKHFGALHKLFNEQYEIILEIVDSVAERARSLGVQAHATLKEFIKNGTIIEHPNQFEGDMHMIADLVTAHQIIIAQLRPAIATTQELNDMGTNNFLCELLEKHEKMAWMLQAHLEERA
jgi:starvation-inducible DNA-binding protein